MRKVYVFAGFVLALFIIFACTIPTSMEVKGTPKVKFAANMDFNDMFSDMMGNVFDSGDNGDDFKIQDCIKTEIRTFLISMNLIDETLEFDLDIPTNGDLPDKIVVGGIEYEISHVTENVVIKLEENVPLVKEDGSQETIKMDFSSLNESLEGFNFDENAVKARLYINGSELIDKIYIDLHLGDQTVYIRDIERETSGIDRLTNSDNEYTGTNLPAGGQMINIAPLLNSKEEVEITYDVYMPEGTTIHVDWLGEVNIVVELLIWVPLNLVAVNDNAEFAFPDDLMNGVGEFVNSITDVVQSMALVIEMNRNPFAEGTLVVKSKGITIENPLSSTSLNFAISEDDMKAIIDPVNSPFAPSFAVVFAQGQHLIMPRELRMTTVSLKADLHYIIEF
jgi:hypothetical protein